MFVFAPETCLNFDLRGTPSGLDRQEIGVKDPRPQSPQTAKIRSLFQLLKLPSDKPF